MTISSDDEDLALESAPKLTAPRSRSNEPKYLDLDRLKNAEGIIAIISQRQANQVFTFGIFKEFERDGRSERTSFISFEHGDSVLAMTKLVLERIAEIAGNPKLMRELQAKAKKALAAQAQVTR